MELESPKVESFFQFSQSLVGTERDDEYSLFEPEEEKPKHTTFNVFDAFQIPAAPTDFEDALSQVTQTDVASTQVFDKNCDQFKGIKERSLARYSGNPRSFATRKPRAFNQYDRQPREIPNEDTLESWPGFQNSQRNNSAPLEDSFEDDEIQLTSSPELFTPRNNVLESASRNDDGQQECYDHFNFQQYDDTRHSHSHNLDTPGQFVIQDDQRSTARGDSDHGSAMKLKSTAEIPEPFRSVFQDFPYFNIVQSTVFKEVMYSDKPMVVCAPTGSGKTVIFELAIVRLLMNAGTDFKIVYMAPMKALCSERTTDWTDKFESLGLKCKEVTGDSQLDDYFELQEVQIIMTTPEKWDSITRKWKDNRSLVDSVKLFLIDEVHLLNDGERGATVEAVISRMKTVQATSTRSTESGISRMRLLAISATIPNVADVGLWLGSLKSPATHYSMDDSYRPVKLRKVVLGFAMSNNTTEFRFDLSLNYKLSGIIQAYSDRKPTIVFCSTRKSAQQAASTLIKDARFIMNAQHRQRLQRIADSLHDAKLRELVVCGVGYHHAGLDSTDRKLVEALFTKGDLPVLFSTSTLAVGVNLPAHLVIIKSTTCYIKGMFTEYSEAQILQMIGRAGRPQFDTSATAVILTTAANKKRYTALLEGSQHIESSLHHHLIEHLNAEIVLNTITDVSIALEWLKSTFLYIRILKNPTYYGIPQGLGEDALEHKLQDICLKNLNTLKKAGLIRMDDGFDLKPKEPGRLMARYYIAYDSMKQFLDVKQSQNLDDLVALISKCKEFCDVKLRVSEKRVLNSLNKNKEKTIRFPISGKIKTTNQKVNCLIQANLGCLQVNEFSLSQDVSKIFRSGQRVSRCLTELMMLKDDDYKTVLNAVIMEKCIKARLWENSQFVSRQLEKVGATLSNLLVNAGLTTFNKIEETHPREIELIVNRHPPFGSQIRDAASSLPKYEVSIEQIGAHNRTRADIVVTVTMTNHIKRKEFIKSDRTIHFCVLIIGDAANRIVHKQRLGDAVFMREGTWSKRVEIRRAPKSSELSISIISQSYVGIDVHSTFTPYYNGPLPWTEAKVEKPQTLKRNVQGQALPNSSQRKVPRTTSACNHRCLNKNFCGHECCKHGVTPKTKEKWSKRNESTERSLTSNVAENERSSKKPMESFLDQLHKRTQAIPGTPAAKRLRAMETRADSPKTVAVVLEEKFGYTPRMKPKQQHLQVHLDRNPELVSIDWPELHCIIGREQERLTAVHSSPDYFNDSDDELLAHPWCFDEDMSASVENTDSNAFSQRRTKENISSKPSSPYCVTDSSGRMQSLEQSERGNGDNIRELYKQPIREKKKHCTTTAEVQITKVESIQSSKIDTSCVKNSGYLPPSLPFLGVEDLSRAGRHRSGHQAGRNTHF